MSVNQLSAQEKKQWILKNWNSLVKRKKLSEALKRIWNLKEKSVVNRAKEIFSS